MRPTLEKVDCETNAYISLCALLPQGYQHAAQKFIGDRVRAFRDGVERAQLEHPAWDKALKEVDPDLQLREDFIGGLGLIIERYSDESEGYTMVMPWPSDINGTLSASNVQAMLRSCDMWRNGLDPFAASDPQKVERYLRRRRDAALRKQAENLQKAQERVEAALDSLGSKRRANFEAVERAVRTGETIYAHGDDAKRLEQLISASQRAMKEAYQQKENPHDMGTTHG